VITVRKIMRSANAMMPGWLLGLFLACLVIPGPFDELAVIVVTGILGIIQPVRFRRATSAWRGGKSHRAS
jgi:chromate transport protein ChrA